MEQVRGGLPELGGGLEELVTPVEHRPVPASRRLVVVRLQPGVTIPYLKWIQKSNLNFEIGGDFWEIWLLCVPKKR